MHTGRGHRPPAVERMTDAVEHMIQAAELSHMLKKAKQQFQSTLDQALRAWGFFNPLKCNLFTL